MTSETDAEFINGAEYAYGHHMVPQHRTRLFALARRGAAAADEIDRLRAVLREIKWRSADRDNMEFSATITYSQMDKIRALGEKE